MNQDIELLDLALETSRLILRTPVPDDAENFYNIARDPEIHRNIYTWPKNTEDAIESIAKIRKLALEKTHHIVLFVLKETSTPVGIAGLNRIDGRHRKAGIAYWCDKNHWRKGYTSEAVLRLMQFGFTELRLERIEAASFVHNDASAKLMVKVGMRFEYTARHEFMKDGKFLDAHHYAILKTDWEERQ